MRIFATVFCLFTALGADAAHAQDPKQEPAAVKPALDSYAEALERYEKRRAPKVVGGKPAPPGAFPWLVAVNIAAIDDPYWAHYCGGAIYSERWIVTAAHCVYAKPRQLAITAGTNQLIQGSPRFLVKQIHVTPGYDDRTTDHDLALLELEQPLVLGERIKPVPFADLAMEPGLLRPGAMYSVPGWGATTQGGMHIHDLRYVEVPFVEREECNRPLAYDGAVTENMFCAGYAAGVKDSCQGDSGGPLTANTNAKPVLVGVVGAGKGCGQPDRVGVYTRIAKHLSWIRACVADPSKCK